MTGIQGGYVILDSATMILDRKEAAVIHYLSVHDLVCINTTVTGQTLSFDYETLEQAMAAQYSYGDSRNIPVQAANLLSTLISREPFEYGNLRTAFVATAAFLNANGHRIKVEDE